VLVCVTALSGIYYNGPFGNKIGINVNRLSELTSQVTVNSCNVTQTILSSSVPVKCSDGRVQVTSSKSVKL